MKNEMIRLLVGHAGRLPESSFRGRIAVIFAIISFTVLNGGCVRSRIVSDYREEAVFRFVRGLYLIQSSGGFGLVEPGGEGTPDTFDPAVPRGRGKRVWALVLPGDRVVIRRISRSNPLSSYGPHIWIEGEILDGEAKGAVVGLSRLSLGSGGNAVYSNPLVLVPAP
jgi:hypothetical protein